MSTEKTYTKQDVINQSLVAFGQGTNFMRVSSLACREFVEMGSILIENRDLEKNWGETAVQVLERVRMMGRVSVALATEAGRTSIDERDVQQAMRKVGLISKTEYCPRASTDDSGDTVTTAGGHP